MGGAEMGGQISAEHLHEHLKTNRESSANKIPVKNHLGTIAKKGAILLTPIMVASGVAIAWDSFDAKNNRIAALEENDRNQDAMLDAALDLGSAGVQFSDVRIIEDEVIVKVPGTSQNCQAISFNYETTTGGWQLRLDQSDAAGHVYDQATASNAQSVTALVEDLCS